MAPLSKRLMSTIFRRPCCASKRVFLVTASSTTLFLDRPRDTFCTLAGPTATYFRFSLGPSTCTGVASTNASYPAPQPTKGMGPAANVNKTSCVKTRSVFQNSPPPLSQNPFRAGVSRCTRSWCTPCCIEARPTSPPPPHSAPSPPPFCLVRWKRRTKKMESTLFCWQRGLKERCPPPRRFHLVARRFCCNSPTVLEPESNCRMRASTRALPAAEKRCCLFHSAEACASSARIFWGLKK